MCVNCEKGVLFQVKSIGRGEACSLISESEEVGFELARFPMSPIICINKASFVWVGYNFVRIFSGSRWPEDKQWHPVPAPASLCKR